MSTSSLKDEMWRLPQGQPDGDLECVDLGGGVVGAAPARG